MERATIAILVGLVLVVASSRTGLAREPSNGLFSSLWTQADLSDDFGRLQLVSQQTGHELPLGTPVERFSPLSAYEACPEECVTHEPLQAPEDNGWWFTRKTTSLSGTYIAGDGDKLGIADFGVSSSFSLNSLPLLSLTPAYQMLFLNGPETTDLPGTLYRANLDIAWFQPLSEQWFLQLAITPGVAADFETNSSEMVRVMGRALAFYQAGPEWKWAFGVVYLDREDLPVIPAVGVIYTPTPDIKFDFMFPKPRFAYRYREQPGKEHWWYIGAEIGGGSYAIERTIGTTEFTDVVSIGELKAMMGLEFKTGTDPKNLDLLFYEIGVVFNRDVEYESGIGDYSPDSTLLVRAGLVF